LFAVSGADAFKKGVISVKIVMEVAAL